MSNQDFPVVQGRTLIEALILCLLAITVGLCLNFTTVYNAFTGRLVVAGEVAKDIAPADTAPDDAIASPALDPFPVPLEEIDDLLAEGALLIDARSLKILLLDIWLVLSLFLSGKRNRCLVILAHRFRSIAL